MEPLWNQPHFGDSHPNVRKLDCKKVFFSSSVKPQEGLKDHFRNQTTVTESVRIDGGGFGAFVAPLTSKDKALLVRLFF